MQTDSLFYALFQSLPSLLFELLERDPEEAEGYQFASVELKQTAFRIDGVFRPPDAAPTAPVFFVEVQFQRDPQLYRRLFSEALLYLRQNPAVEDWRAVVLYPDPSIEVTERALRTFLDSPNVQIIYLSDLGVMAELTPGLGILRLLIEPVETVPEAARGLIERVQQSGRPAVDTSRLIELIETIVVYTFPRLSREEIAAMLGLSELKETRVYQETREEALREGREEEARSLISRLLTRQLGPLPDSLQAQVKALSLEQLEALGEALFDFAKASDLETWLASRER